MASVNVNKGVKSQRSDTVMVGFVGMALQLAVTSLGTPLIMGASVSITSMV